MQGWVAKTGEGFTLLKAEATLTDCDAKELRTSSPLVLISAGSRTLSSGGRPKRSRKGEQACHSLDPLFQG